MLTFQSHKFLIAITAIVILILGIFLGKYLVENLGGDALDSVKIGLMFTTIILILLVGTFVLEVKIKLDKMKSGRK